MNNAKKLAPLLTASKVAPAEIAISYSDHARAMIETEALDKRSGFPKRYRGVVEMWHSDVQALGYHRDVRFENAELEGLKLLITPAMPYVSQSFIARVLKFVNAGGTWIAGPVTGIRDKEHTVPTQAGLGLLDELAGVNTKFVVPLTKTGSTGSAFGITTELSGWCAAMQPKPFTKSVGVINNGIAAKLNFLTERQIGKGKVVVLGAQPHGDNQQKFIDALIKHYAKDAGIHLPYSVTPGIIVSPRIDAEGKTFWIAINMEQEQGEWNIPSGSKDAISKKQIHSTNIALARYQWRAVYPNI